MRFLLVLVAVVLAIAARGQESHSGAALTITLPPETASFRPGPGADVAQSTCLTCHSADYVAIQPPKPHDFWKEEVNKMVKNYGATIPTDRIEPIADYITRTYGIEAINGPTVPGAPEPKP